MRKKVVLMMVMLIGCSLLMGCCCCGITDTPSTIEIEFEKTIWALPIGIDIFYPVDISNRQKVVILSTLPVQPVQFEFNVTTAIITASGYQYTAIPVAVPTNVGVRWYIILSDELVEIERFNNDIEYIEVHPVSF